MSHTSGQPRDTFFIVTTDPNGNLFLYCDRTSCSWIKPFARNTSMHRLEQMYRNHFHPREKS